MIFFLLLQHLLSLGVSVFDGFFKTKAFPLFFLKPTHYILALCGHCRYWVSRQVPFIVQYCHYLAGLSLGPQLRSLDDPWVRKVVLMSKVTAGGWLGALLTYNGPQRLVHTALLTSSPA